MINFDFTGFFDGADRAQRGLNSIGAALGLKYVTAAIYTPIHQDAVTKHQAFQEARSSKLDSYQNVRDLRGPTDEWLLNVRNYLSAFLGANYSAAWAPLGFVNSLELPRRDAGRCQLLNKISIYFTSHPNHANAAGEFTAIKAQTLCEPFTTGRALIENCKFDTRDKRDQRDAAKTLLEGQLVRLRKELELALSDTDPRWLKFFDRIPGDPRVPEKVEDVTATVQPGKIISDWPDVARAARYKLEKQVVGTDADFVPVLTVDESEAEVPLPGVTPGTVVKLRITATNGVGPGASSDVLELLAA